MLNVDRWFPSGLNRELIEEDTKRGVNVYAKPNTNATVVGVLRESNSWTQLILATVGDDWYHILCDDGLSEYVEAHHFWDGNG